MSELIAAVKAWPVIVQGALGSALFWVLLFFGTKARTFFLSKHSIHSKTSRLSWLINQKIRLEAVTAKSVEERSHNLIFLFYRTSRLLLKAVIWLVYGLAINSMYSPAGVFGYIVCLIYIFKAYEIMGPVDTKSNLESKLEEIKKEISKIGY